MSPSDLERRVLDMLLDHPGEHAEALRAQRADLEVTGRTYTGLSLQSSLNPDLSAPVAGTLNVVLGGILGRHSSHPDPIGFNLFVRNGRLVLLEGVAFSDEWPDDESAIRLERIPLNYEQDRKLLSPE